MSLIKKKICNIDKIARKFRGIDRIEIKYSWKNHKGEIYNDFTQPMVESNGDYVYIGEPTIEELEYYLNNYLGLPGATVLNIEKHPELPIYFDRLLRYV